MSSLQMAEIRKHGDEGVWGTGMTLRFLGHWFI
jgi:hypothetical protein